MCVPGEEEEDLVEMRSKKVCGSEVLYMGSGVGGDGGVVGRYSARDPARPALEGTALLSGA